MLICYLFLKCIMITKGTAHQEKVQDKKYLILFTHKSSMNWSVLHLSLRDSYHQRIKTKNNASIINLHRIAKVKSIISKKVVELHNRIKTGIVVNFLKMARFWRYNSLWITTKSQWLKKRRKNFPKLRKKLISHLIYFLSFKKQLQMSM